MRIDKMSPAATDSKQERSGYELRILIHHKVAGAVIGKGGENIKKLREHDIDDVTIPDRQSPERIVIVQAKSLEIIKKCLKEIIVKIDEVNHKVLNTKDSEIRLLVHSSHGGAIIGKAGSNVKELKEKTGCQIKVYTELCPYSTDRVVSIGGERDGVVDCATEVVRICRENPVKTNWRKYDTANFNVYFADKYGGYADYSYRGGGGIGGLSAAMNSLQIHGAPAAAMMGGGGPRGGGGGGAAAALEQQAAQQHGYQDVSGFRYGAPPSGGSGNFQPSSVYHAAQAGYGDSIYGGGWKGQMAMGGGADYYYQRAAAGPVESVQLTVPEEVTGAVIGRRGDKIRSIKMDSGADISLDRDSNVGGEKVITVTGNHNQIQMATFLLQQAVRNSPQGRKLLGKTGISS